MPVDWPFADELIALGGAGGQERQIAHEDGVRQQATAREILAALREQPGIVLADEVGMGKTYVALAVIASVLQAERRSGRPVVVMTPPGLTAKWAREWEQFRSLCCRRPADLRWVRTAIARNPTEFFKLMDDDRATRARLILMTTSCFSRGLQDPWIKLALIRFARSKTKMDDTTKRRLWKWGSSLVRLKKYGRLTREVVERLLKADLSRWKKILVEEQILREEDDDPIPEHLLRHGGGLEYGALVDILRTELPGHKGAVSERLEHDARAKFNEECQRVYWQWVKCAVWRAPLLVLDEAHHAKNDQTKLASLFRTRDSEQLVAVAGDVGKRPLLWDKFDRMLFLTATPFQLGHQELIRVLQSFAGAKWTGPGAPAGVRADYFAAMKDLERRLDANRMAGRQLDRLWGRLSWSQVSPGSVTRHDATVVEEWWEEARAGTSDAFATELLRAVDECRRTKRAAESDAGRPWASLRSWVIRHNRPTHLTTREGRTVERRRRQPGGAVAMGDGLGSADGRAGLLVPAHAAVPFLLSARAQGELAAGTAKTRAYFAEGLCSSYEAFHHTRKQRGDVRDVDDDGVERTSQVVRQKRPPSLVPLEWYEAQVEYFVPSKRADGRVRFLHPKLQPVVERTVSLWKAGEKVVLFCFYRETAKALRFHLRREVESAIISLTSDKLQLPRDAKVVTERLESITRRISDEESPFHAALTDVLRSPFDTGQFEILREHETDLLGVLLAYVRTPAFIARYLPLGDPALRAALAENQKRNAVIRAGAEAMAAAFRDRADESGVTMLRRIEEFYGFAKELAERAQVPVEEPEEGEAAPISPLQEYLDAVAVYVKTRGRADDDDDDEEDSTEGRRGGAFRMLPTVRMVYGKTKRDVRERLMLAFNSPLFPEILISSAVLAEGVDLHRFCRYVIHHDLCWNPSTLEQRTGRLDRIRCKAEWTGEPIVIYEPYLAGSADEKMFRVVRDRERWFQIVMGQKFEFDERASEEVAGRVPLPERLASELVFDLARYHRSPAQDGTAQSQQPSLLPVVQMLTHGAVLGT